MPRKSRSPKSQALPVSSQSRKVVSKSLSQPTISAAFAEAETSKVDIDEQANDVVRYLVFKGGECSLIKKNEMQKNVVPKAGRDFEKIIEKAAQVLREVYGYNLILIDQPNTSLKSYIVSNALPYLHNSREVEYEELPEDVNKIILMLILTHIFMSTIAVNEASLYGFLKKLHIDVEVRHPVFGQIKDYITHTLTKQKYINMQYDSATKHTNFSWGPRAEKEISKHDILKFVCKIYKDRLPQNWDNQYREATEQHLENEKIREENNVEIED